jgi:hypothetical protein
MGYCEYYTAKKVSWINNIYKVVAEMILRRLDRPMIMRRRGWI